MTGKIISHYQILEKLGEGGMGVVYRAEDTKLGRQVAIKVLPEAFAMDPERLARFEREARLLASLNHPNIAAIHGLEEVEGKGFLIMELVEGQTLAERLQKGPLPLDEILENFRQIAEGLEAAHEKGIIHRDLKPANIKITPEGKVKILDFGLAKAFQEESVAADPSQSPTLTAQMSLPGVILGTAAYMSPEQARGKPLDKRADIWAFGAVLYEMLTGRRAFVGETVSDTLAAVLKTDPNWTALPEATPAPLRSLLRRCLDRDVKQRLRDIGEARVAFGRIDANTPERALELNGTGRSGSQSTVPGGKSGSRIWSKRLAWLVCGVLAVCLLTLAIWWHNSKPTEQTMYFSAPFAFEAHDIAVAPNGHTVAVVGYRESARKNVIWLYEVGSQEAKSLADTEGATFPFWSADGKFLAFFADGKLKKMGCKRGRTKLIA